MSQFAEPSTRARKTFFLVALLWAVTLLLLNLGSDPAPLIGSDSEKIKQFVDRAFYSLVMKAIFYFVLSSVIVYFSFKAVKSKQWPPPGFPVPFRIRIYSINQPYKVWSIAAFILSLYAMHIILEFYRWHTLRGILSVAAGQ